MNLSCDPIVFTALVIVAAGGRVSTGEPRARERWSAGALERLESRYLARTWMGRGSERPRSRMVHMYLYCLCKLAAGRYS